jgi:hypothetical protein
MDRRRRTISAASSAREDEVRGLLEDAASSGVSRAEFCRQRGLKAGTLSWWKHQLKLRDRRRGRVRVEEPAPLTAPGGGTSSRRVHRKKPAEPEATVRLVPLTVRVSAAAPAAVRASLEVVVAGGRLVRVPPDFDSSVLIRLVETLQGAPC